MDAARQPGMMNVSQLCELGNGQWCESHLVRLKNLMVSDFHPADGVKTVPPLVKLKMFVQFAGM